MTWLKMNTIQQQPETFKCQWIGCVKREHFVLYSGLQKHMYSAHLHKRLECVCGAQFKSKKSRNNHHKTCTDFIAYIQRNTKPASDAFNQDNDEVHKVHDNNQTSTVGRLFNYLFPR